MNQQQAEDYIQAKFVVKAWAKIITRLEVEQEQLQKHLIHHENTGQALSGHLQELENKLQEAEASFESAIDTAVALRTGI